MTEEQKTINEIAEKLVNGVSRDEQYRQIQLMSYRAGYYAAISEIIGRLMHLQSEKVRTPYDQS